MRNIREVLISLEPTLLMDIESSYSSIFKIDTTDEVFKEHVRTKKIPSETKYLINPNLNSAHGMIFLDAKGETLLKANFFANLISHVPLDFEYEIKDYTLNHPLEKLLSSIVIR